MSHPVLTSFLKSLRISAGADLTFAQSIAAAGPNNWWRVDETTGVVAADAMGNGDLEYESDAATAGYSIAASSNDIGGQAKDINADTARQIYDPSTGGAVTGPTDYVAKWTMDTADITAPTIFDSTANNHDATMVNTPTTGVTGQKDEAVLFDGVNEYATIVNHIDFRPTLVSISSWVKVASGLTRSGLFQSFNQSATTNGFALEAYEDGTVYFTVASATGTVEHVDHKRLFSDTLIDDSQWHHIVATYDGITLKIYIDGVLDVFVAYAGGLGYDGTTNIPSIGRISTNGDVLDPFDGIIDDLKLFNRALTETEIQDTYLEDGGKLREVQDYVARWELETAPTVVPPVDFVAEWKLDSDGSETNAAHPATLVNTPTFGIGFLDNAMILDGVDQYATVVDHANLKPTTFTVCAWIRKNIGVDTQDIFQSYSLHASVDAGFFFNSPSDGTAFIHVGKATGNISGVDHDNARSISKIDDNAWHHVAATYDGVSIKIYVDGILEATTAWVGIAYDATNYVQIGARSTVGTPVKFFNGRIDNLQLFNYAATAAQITALARIAPDATWRGHQGRIDGSPISVAGNGFDGNNALTFDGVDDFVVIQNHADLRPTEMSVSAWVNTLATANGSIIGNWGWDAVEYSGFLCKTSTSGFVQLLVANNTGGTLDTHYKQVSSISTINDGSWHYIAATYDGANIKIYIDGVLETTEAWAGGLVYDTAADFTSIGVKDHNAVLQDFFNGKIDDVRLYPRAITQSEVSSIFNSRIAAPPEDFVAEWLMDESGIAAPSDWIDAYTFDDVNTTTIFDEAVISRDITITNTPGEYVSGLNGNALTRTLSGLTKGYNFAHGLGTTIANFSVSVWFRLDATLTSNDSYGAVFQLGCDFTNSGLLVDVSPSVGSLRYLVGNNTAFIYPGDTEGDLRGTGWHHLCIVCTESGSDGLVQIWIDGNGGGVATLTNNIHFTSATSNLLSRNSSAASYLEGCDLEDFQIFNRALSEDEILAINGTYFTKETLGNHDANLIALPTFESGWEQNALTLNGSTQYATIVDHADLKPANVSVAGWIKTSSVASGVILSNFDAVSNLFTGYYVYVGAGGNVSIFICKGTGSVNNVDYETAATSVANDGQWHHIAFSFDGVEIVSYLDGAHQQTVPWANAIVYNGTEEPHIGVREWETTKDNYFNGSIDKLQVFNRAVTAAEVEAMAMYTAPTVAGDFTIGDLSTSDFTIECAFKIDTAVLSMALMGRLVDTVNWSLNLDAASTNILKLQLVQDDDTDRTQSICADLTTAGVAADGVWHWLSIRMDYDGLGLLTCFIDGSSVFSLDVSGWSGVWKSSLTSQFTIGDTVEAGTQPWNGGIDEPAIYLKAITDQERNRNWTTWDDGTATVTPATVGVLPSNVTDTPNGGAYTTPLLSATVADGAGPFSYLWTSDGIILTPDNPTDPDTTFSGNEVSDSTTETLTCTVTDHGDGDATSFDTVTTSITWGPIAATVDIDVEDIVDTVPAGAYTTPLLSTTVINGIGPFTYLWTSDGSNLTPDNPTSANTTFSGTEANVTTTETLKCTVTDTGNGSITSEDIVLTNITWEANAFSIDVTPDILADARIPNGVYTTPLLTAAVAGGIGPFTYLWESSSPLLAPDTPTASTSTFSGTQNDVSVTDAVLTCTVIDTGDPFNQQDSDFTLASVEWTGLKDYFGYWTMDNLTGLVINDETANSHDVTMDNTIVQTTGYSGKALACDGVQKGLAANHADFETSAFSFACWNKSPRTYDLKRIAGFWQSGSPNAGWFLARGFNPRYKFFLDNGSGTRKILDSSKTANNVWEHVVITYDGSTMRMYINGVLDATKVYSGSIAFIAGTQFYMGGDDTNPASTRHKGNVDEAKIYDRVLSATEINNLYNLTLPISMELSPLDISEVIDPSAWYVSPTISAIVSGGVGPFTYAWTRTVGTTLSISGSTTASAITVEGQGSSEITLDTFKCIVTDTATGLTAEETIDININWDAV